MATFENELKKAITRGKGTFGVIRQALTSSNIKTTATALTTAATGRLRIVGIELNTDATGLAGGTNFQIVRTTANIGATTIVADAVAGLGANITHSATFGAAGTGIAPSVTNNIPAVLEGGDSLSYSNTAAAGTGAGVIVVTITYQRIDDNADIVSTGA